MTHKRSMAWIAAAVTVLTAIAASPAHAWNPFGTAGEPTLPYLQPNDASVPVRGCATITPTPTAPPAGTIPAFQFIYGWHESEGNHYEAVVEKIAKVIDRIDWLLDESSNYDQHIKFSCRYTPNGTYADYARALIVPEKLDIAAPTGVDADWFATGNDIHAAGYDDANRWYFVFTDAHVPSGSNVPCEFPPALTAGGVNCWGTAEVWDSGVAGHELLHLLGAGHAWSQQSDQQYIADVMMDFDNYWMVDQDFNTNYDPSELTATFYRDNPVKPDTFKWNIAAHPTLTTPTCCDVGYSNDLLTAQERTVEADAPWASPSGFTVSGGGWIHVTPPCGSDGNISCFYYDGRRSLQMNVQSWGEGKVALTSRKPVTAGQSYKFYTRLRSDASGTVKLRLAWYNASGTLISNSDSGLIAMDAGWPERTWGPVAAPPGATQVELSVVSPAGQNFSYQLDSLQLMHCNPNCRPGM